MGIERTLGYMLFVMLILPSAYSAATVTVSCASFTVGSSTSCTANANGGIPGGTFTFTTSAPTGTFIGSPCTAAMTSCSVTYSDTSAGTPTITATYSKNAGISGNTIVSVNKATPSVSVSCSSFNAGTSTSCRANIVSGFNPTGTVSFSTSSSTGSFSGTPCTLSLESCSVTYSDTSAGTPTITATYSGDGNNVGSSGSGSVTVNPSGATVSVSCVTFIAGSSGSCTALVIGNSPTGTVSFSTSSSTGSFSSATCTLSSGSCSTTYSDTSAGTPTITATYSGDGNNSGGLATTLASVTSITQGSSQTTQNQQPCGFKIDFTSPYSVFVNTSKASFNFTVQKLSPYCSIIGAQGTLMISQESSPGLSKYMYNFSIGQISTIPETMTIDINASNVPYGEDLATLSFKTGAGAYNYTQMHFLLIGPAEVFIDNISADPSTLNLGEPINLVSDFTNKGFFNAINLTENVRVTFPDFTTYTFSIPLEKLHAFQRKTFSFDLGRVTTKPGNYTIQENVTYTGNYTFNNNLYSFPELITNTVTCTYHVNDSRAIKYSVTPITASTPILEAGPLKLVNTPFLTQAYIEKGSESVSLGLSNSDGYPIIINLTTPTLQFGTLNSSADSLHLYQNHTEFVSFTFTPFLNATPGLYQVPINATVKSDSGNLSLNTNIYLLIDLKHAANSLSVSKNIVIPGDGSEAKVVLSVFNPSNLSVHYITLTQQINSSITESSNSIVAEHGDITKIPNAYLINWSITSINKGKNSTYVVNIYNISNHGNLLYLLNDKIGMASSISGNTVNISIVNVTTPEFAYVNSSAYVSLAAIYSGDARAKIGFGLVGPSGVSIVNPYQEFYAAPDSILLPKFTVNSTSLVGVQSFKLYVTGPFEPITKEISINFTAQPTLIEELENALKNPSVIIFVELALAALSVLIIKAYSIMKRGADINKPSRREELARLEGRMVSRIERLEQRIRSLRRTKGKK